MKPPRHSCSLVDGLEVPALSVKTWMIPRCFPIIFGYESGDFSGIPLIDDGDSTKRCSFRLT